MSRAPAIARTIGRGVLAGSIAGLLGAAASPTDAWDAKPKDLFAPRELGGVSRILRYAVAEPDRSEIAFLFLTAPETPKGPPQQVQVIGQGGEHLQLSDTEGADCTLERVWIRGAGQGGPEIVYATRPFSGALKTDVESEPAAMDVSVFRPRRGEEPGDSIVTLRLVGPPRRSRPVCRAADVQREMVRLSSTEPVVRR